MPFFLIRSFLITSDVLLCPFSPIARSGYLAYDLHHLSHCFAAFFMTLSRSSLTCRVCHYVKLSVTILMFFPR